MSVSSGPAADAGRDARVRSPGDGTTLVTGHARVLREQAHHVYALRFERLLEPVRAALYEMAASLVSPEPQAG